MSKRYVVSKLLRFAVWLVQHPFITSRINRRSRGLIYSLVMIALSLVQSFTRILIHNAILFINTLTMFGTTKVIG